MTRYIFLIFFSGIFGFLSIVSLSAQNESADSLQNLYSLAESDSVRGHLAHRISISFQNQGKKIEQEQWAKIAYTHFDEADLPEPKGHSLYTIAASFYYRGIYDSMRPYMEEMAAIGTELENDKLLGKAHVGLSLMESSQGNYQPAVDYAFEALQHFEAANDSAGLASIYGNIAVLYWKLGNSEKSIGYFLKELPIDSARNYKWGLAAANENIGTIYFDEGDSKKALPYQLKAAKLYEEFGDSSALVHVFINLANTYRGQKKLDSTFYYLETAEKIAEKRQIMADTDRLNQVRGLAWIDLEEWEKADNAFEKSLSYALESKDLMMQRNNYFYLSQTRENLGRYKQALSYLKEYNVLRDSMLNKDNSRQIEELNILYETEKQKTELAEKELTIARQDNRFYLTLAGLGLLGLMGIILFMWYRNQQLYQQRETEHVLAIQKAEAENLREVDKMKSRFFANISHEFRTPLTLILGPLGQLVSGKVKGDPQTLFFMMKRNAERLLQLINQLLDLSKLEAGKMDMKLSRVNIWQFLRLQAGNFESRALSKNIRFHVNIPDNSLQVIVDQDKFEKTITNLLSNAFKFTPEEGDVWLAAEAVGDNVEISIRDNGIGIPDDQLEHIFDRFYQVDAGEYEGTGIGLALTRELIELHKGEVSVSSERGKGSIFVLKLPINLQSDQDLPEEITLPDFPATNFKIAEKQDVTPVLHKGFPSLLIVEDNEDVRLYLREILKTSYQITEAKNGLEGLEIAREQIPDIIISDIMMPEKDGVEFTREVKNDARTSHIPVILLTAKAGRDSKLEGLETGADDYLPKPFDEEELMIRAKNLLDQRKRMGAQFAKDIVKLSPDEIMVDSADKKFLDRVIGVIEMYMSNEAFSIEDLGREVGMSRSQLHRKLKALTDQSPSVFLRTIRLKRAYQLLQEKAGTSAEISYLVGFGSPAYFSKCFRDQYGITPGEV